VRLPVHASERTSLALNPPPGLVLRVNLPSLTPFALSHRMVDAVIALRLRDSAIHQG